MCYKKNTIIHHFLRFFLEINKFMNMFELFKVTLTYKGGNRKVFNRVGKI